MQEFIDKEEQLRKQAIEEHLRIRQEEADRRRRMNRCIASCCYVAGAGAFGTFIRWLQVQTAFTEPARRASKQQAILCRCPLGDRADDVRRGAAAVQ